MVKNWVKLQNELSVPKNQYSKFGSFKYRSCEDILEAVKPLLLKYNLELIVTDELVYIGDRYYIKSTATISDDDGNSAVSSAYSQEETKSWYTDQSGKRKSDTQMNVNQLTGSASSYSRKYALNALLMLDDNKDADTDEYHQYNNYQSYNSTQAQQPKTQPQKVDVPAEFKAKSDELKAIATQNGLSYAEMLKKSGFDKDNQLTWTMNMLEVAEQLINLEIANKQK